MVGARDNNDIKIPYRLPINAITHDKECKEECINKATTHDITKAIDDSQAAQVGYHCDYCNKRQPIGVHELREWMKGHRNLTTQLKDESLSYLAKRHALRICSDCFGRGIVRSPNETTKLNDNAGHEEPTAAEMTCSAKFSTFPGGAYLAIIEGRASVDPKKIQRGLLYTKTHKGSAERVIIRNAALFYGYRDDSTLMHYLSPYEFHRYWEIKQTSASKYYSSRAENLFHFSKAAPREIVHCPTQEQYISRKMCYNLIKTLSIHTSKRW